MSARTITITADGSIIVIRGYKVAQLARQAGLRPTYAGSVGGWMLDAHRLPNLIAWLEYRNVRYELKGVVGTTAGGTSVPPAPKTPQGEAPLEPEPSLW